MTVTPGTSPGSVGVAQTVCSGTAPSTLNLTGHVGVVVKWQSSLNGTTWTDIANTTTSHSPGPLTSTTHFRAIVQSGSCPGIASGAAIITVNPPTVGGTVTPSQSICNGTAPYTLFLQNQVGTVVKWQSSPNGMAPWTDIAHTGTSYSPGVLTATVHFRAVVQSGVCPPANSTAAIITVNAVPTVSMPPFSPVCVNGAVIPLNMGSPAGGTYSGVGVNGAGFTPSAAGVGTHVITYTYTNGAGCTASTSQPITVNALPTVTLANFAPVCLNTAVFALSGGSPTGGSYSGPGVSGGNFNPATAGVGTHTSPIHSRMEMVAPIRLQKPSS